MFTIGEIFWISWILLEIVVVIGMIVWGFETGQWKDIEEPKYRMLIDHEMQPWPGREKPPKEKKPEQPDVKE